jgi:hypothetical protein
MTPGGRRLGAVEDIASMKYEVYASFNRERNDLGEYGIRVG